MIDAGGGSFLRFGEAAATFTDLDFIGLSHFHTDHSADFPALLKSGYFANRDRPLTVSGPGGNSRFPGLQKYLTSMIGPDNGAYAYLSGYLDGSGGLARLIVHEIDNGDSAPEDLVAGNKGISISAVRVPHGIVPAVAYRVEIDGKSIVFASDQNGGDAGFAEFASNASVLIMHMPIPENADAGARQLHAVPSKIAAIAESAQADTLLLSHFMARSLRSLDNSVKIIDDGYNGALMLAEDLYCQIVR
jgi:ribonuclease BN (tRNA processing enzyme)